MQTNIIVCGIYQTQVTRRFLLHTAMVIRSTVVASRSTTAADPAPAPITTMIYNAYSHYTKPHCSLVGIVQTWDN